MVGKAGRSIKVAVTDRITIFGYGQVGRATAARLMAEGREVIIAQRRAPPDLPKGATFAPSDALDRDAVVKAVRGAGQLVVAVGFAYSGVVWREAWPKAMANFVAACKATGARMVFIDNLYMYGPQSRPLVETMPLSDTGWKPAARSAATRIWMDAAAKAKPWSPRCGRPTSMGPASATPFSATRQSASLPRANRPCSSAPRTCCTITPTCLT